MNFGAWQIFTIFDQPRPRPKRWSLFSRMVSVRPKNQNTGTMFENNDHLLAVARWVILNSLNLLLFTFRSDPAVQALQFLDVISMKDPSQKAQFFRTTLTEVFPYIPRVSLPNN